MKAIHKYQLGMAEQASVMMPEGAVVIRVDGIDGFLWLWAVVDTDAPMIKRDFLLFKTGASMPADILQTHCYLGCGGIFVQMELMMYVWEDANV
ncbi:MAG TPA: hypothetical protein VF800_02705 [Telluria sp.]|jgi:hypothetical protein